MLGSCKIGLLGRPDQLIRRTRPLFVPADDPLPSASAFHVGDSRIGSGQGLFADHAIRAFDCLFVDPALLGLAQGEDLLELFAKYSCLPAADKAIFDALSTRVDARKDAVLAQKLESRGFASQDVYGLIRVSNVFMANAFNFTNETEARGTSYVGDNPIYRRAIFPNIARINHSCMPNAHAHYRREIGSMVIFALQDIEVDDEISISYFNNTMSVKDRQKRAADWGFQCACKACNTESSFQAAHEAILDDLRDCLAKNSSLLALRSISRQVATTQLNTTRDLITRIRHFPFLQPQLPDLFEQCGRLEHAATQDSKALTRAQGLALEVSIKISGHDSPVSRIWIENNNPEGFHSRTSA